MKNETWGLLWRPREWRRRVGAAPNEHECGDQCAHASDCRARKFRKRPVVVEAFQLGQDGPVLASDTFRDWAEQVDFHIGKWVCARDCMEINTLEGIMEAKRGDWIIKGVAGEFYPCKPDIFEQTYDPVDNAEPGDWAATSQGGLGDWAALTKSPGNCS